MSPFCPQGVGRRYLNIQPYVNVLCYIESHNLKKKKKKKKIYIKKERAVSLINLMSNKDYLFPSAFSQECEVMTWLI